MAHQALAVEADPDARLHLGVGLPASSLVVHGPPCSCADLPRSRTSPSRATGSASYAISRAASSTPPSTIIAAPETRLTTRAAAGRARSTRRAPMPTPV